MYAYVHINYEYVDIDILAGEKINSKLFYILIGIDTYFNTYCRNQYY
jgi:hypothetical protein